MNAYFSALKESMKSWKAWVTVLLTLARVFYGYKWVNSGVHKLSWLTDGEANSAGFIGRMIENLSTDRGDPFLLGRLMAKIADTVYLNLIQLTDVLVVVFEIAIGLMIILGFKLLIAMVAAIFLNLQFFAAGSTNNFGYMVTNLIIVVLIPYFDAIGVEGFLRVKKGKALL